MHTPIATNNLYAVKTVLYAIAIFLVMGNVPRIIDVPVMSDGINLGEVILFGVIIAASFFLKEFWRRYFSVLVFVSFIFCFSLIIGLIKFGPDWISIFYNIRQQVILFVSLVGGYSLYKYYGEDYHLALSFFLRIYVFVGILALIIFILFPNSEDLWAVLDQHGIVIHGDPHRNRMLGTYFDPNYFSVIITLPAIFAFTMYADQRKFIYGVLFLFFCSMIVLSESRSGAATGAMVLMMWFIELLLRLLSGRTVSVKNIRMLGVLATLGIFLAIVLASSVGSLSKRIADTGSDDESSMNRLRSLQIGHEMFMTQPLLGYGYNFAVWELLEKKKNTGLDSSVQMILIDFGVLLSSIIGATFVYWIVKCGRRIRIRFGSSSGKNRLWKFYISYVLIVILFASLFNNILFYPFWEIPVIVLGVYLSRLGASSSAGLLSISSQFHMRNNLRRSIGN